MANPEHLYLLTQDIANFNQWREEHPDVIPDLRGADLSNESLCEANLWAANLAEANLSGATLTNTDLSSANLTNSNLSNTNLYEANLDQAYLIGAKLDDADLGTIFNADLDQSLADTLIEMIREQVSLLPYSPPRRV